MSRRPEDGGPVRVSPRVVVRPPDAGDRVSFLAAARDSRGFHRRWGVRLPDDDGDFQAWIARSVSEREVSFLVCDRASGAIAGAFILSEIVRGSFQSAYLGYYAFRAFAGSGYMREALPLVISIAFMDLGLHRVEANIQPGNARSIELVERCGFRREGFSPRYLKLGGRWRDHERWALLREDWRRPRGKERVVRP